MSVQFRPLSHALEDPPQPLSRGDVVLGRYEVQRIIGNGGMATVYLAKHLQTDRLVALKLLDPQISADPAYVERFRREAKAAGRIRSDHVVSIYDFDADETGSLVLVMEYLEGQSVQAAMRNGRMDPVRAMIFARQMLEGLSAAHAAGVVHRDLKPANLYLERMPANTERLKILDFGISKMADGSQEELTRVGQTLGTVAYMAPEQVRGRSSTPDPRVDLYGAAVCLFVMLTGRRPIDAEDTVGLLTALMEREPLTLQQASGLVFSPVLESVVAKGLRKDPGQRFQNAMEMRDALLAAAQSMGLASQVMAAGANIAQDNRQSGVFGAVFKPQGPDTGQTPSAQSLTGVFGPVPMGLPQTPAIASPPTVVGNVRPGAAPAPGGVRTEVLGAVPADKAEALLAGLDPDEAPKKSRSPMVIALAVVGALSLGGAAAMLARRSSTASTEAAANAASASAAAILASASAARASAAAATASPELIARPTASAVAPSAEPSASAPLVQASAEPTAAAPSVEPDPPPPVPTFAPPPPPPVVASAEPPPPPPVRATAAARVVPPPVRASAPPVIARATAAPPPARPTTGGTPRRPPRRRGIVEDAPF